MDQLNRASTWAWYYDERERTKREEEKLRLSRIKFETIEEYIKRGGVIKMLPTAYAKNYLCLASNKI
jgi:hypothetical protein